MTNYKAALKALVEQIERSRLIDAMGHDFALNQAYMEAREMLGLPVRNLEGLKVVDDS